MLCIAVDLAGRRRRANAAKTGPGLLQLGQARDEVGGHGQPRGKVGGAFRRRAGRSEQEEQGAVRHQHHRQHGQHQQARDLRAQGAERLHASSSASTFTENW
jgi:hypothetical protein